MPESGSAAIFFPLKGPQPVSKKNCTTPNQNI